MENIIQRLRGFVKATDLTLLVFLVLVLNVSLAVKLAGLVFIYLAKPDFSFRRSWGRMPWFYAAMSLLVVLQLVFNYHRGVNYLLLAALAALFWLASFLIIHQLRSASEQKDIGRVYGAIRWFFVINAGVTILRLVAIMLETGTLNPYMYVGQNFRFFASTGDHLRGITGDLSTVNMVLNSFATFFFLYRREYVMAFLCFIVALLTTSNIGNFALLAALLYVLIFRNNKMQKAIAICFVGVLVAFIVRISPSNLNYLNNKFAEILHLDKKPIDMVPEDHSEKDQLIANYVQHRKSHFVDSAFREKHKISAMIMKKKQDQARQEKAMDRLSMSEESQRRLHFVSFIEREYGDTNRVFDQAYYEKAPGKLLSFSESIRQARSSIKYGLAGAGAGNFSSKLAFKASNLGIAGKYVEKYRYIAPEFKASHLKLTLRYLLMPSSEHSIINFPNSVFNQLLGEYGLLGLLLFAGSYLWFYVSRFRRLSFGQVLFFLFLFFLPFDYWFESLSIAIMFELMIFLDLRREEEGINASR